MLCLSGFEIYSRWVPLNFEGHVAVIMFRWCGIRMHRTSVCKRIKK